SALHVLQQLGDDLAYGIGRIRDAKALEASEERFRTLAAAAPIGILEVAAGGVVSYANDRSGEIAGRDGAALMGRGWIDAVLPEDAPRLIEISRSRQMGTVAERVRLRRPDGEIRHVNLSAAPQEGGPSSRYVVTLTDVTKEVEAEEALARQAFYDTPTDLPNRSLFLDRLEQELARRRRGAAAFAVLFVDLDDFKVVNDSLGHQAGDSVLREVAKRLADAVRLGETVARFSGDEFAIIVRELRGPEDAVTVANRVLRLLQRPIRHEGHEIIVTGSVGISIPDVDADALSLMRDADVAMYDAKAGGRNRYRIFDKDLHRKVVARFAMEGDLRRALARHEFVLHYQPSIDLRTGRPRGAEALVRWLHPVRGLVLPAEFVPVAEETGLIRELGDWVIREAIAQLARFDAEVAGPRLATLAVNVSARQLDDCDVCEMLARSVARHGVDPQRVAIELTESTVMSESGRARRPLEELRRLGFRVAIDDFGTGYSSLAYLHALPVTTVKVDRSFVRRLGTPSDDATPVVRAIVDLAHAMGLRVVAEGVEEKAQADLLTELGCDGAQGMLWAPPMPANELGRWLGSTATNNSHGTAGPLAT
ncbi:MAG TPA: EAL domain-containing protein, partial [Acidimicrobiales bacterium]|nr:EAL domain-containing protein [Acidimicrobiales bacterium]